jgi:hypothetical protein
MAETDTSAQVAELNRVERLAMRLGRMANETELGTLGTTSSRGVHLLLVRVTRQPLLVRGPDDIIKMTPDRGVISPPTTAASIARGPAGFYQSGTLGPSDSLPANNL